MKKSHFSSRALTFLTSEIEKSEAWFSIFPQHQTFFAMFSNFFASFFLNRIHPITESTQSEACCHHQSQYKCLWLNVTLIEGGEMLFFPLQLFQEREKNHSCSMSIGWMLWRGFFLGPESESLVTSISNAWLLSSTGAVVLFFWCLGKKANFCR